MSLVGRRAALRHPGARRATLELGRWRRLAAPGAARPRAGGGREGAMSQDACPEESLLEEVATSLAPLRWEQSLFEAHFPKDSSTGAGRVAGAPYHAAAAGGDCHPAMRLTMVNLSDPAS